VRRQEEKHRAVIDAGLPPMNRPAKCGVRPSLHYEGEAFSFSHRTKVCLRMARCGRAMRELKRNGGVSGWRAVARASGWEVTAATL